MSREYLGDLQIIDVVWVSTMRANIGIVETFNKITGETKIYIDVVDGIDEEKDIEKIVKLGGRLR